MRIISKFHDYYDCIMREGVDPSRVWVRNEEVIYCQEKLPAYKGDKPEKRKKIVPWPFPESPSIGRYHYRDDKISRTQYMIGFCGKVYPMLKYTLPSKIPVGHIGYEEPQPNFLWNIEDVNEWHQSFLDEDAWNKFTGKKGYKGYKSFCAQAKYAKFFEEVEQGQKRYEKLFVEFNTPVFVGVMGMYDQDTRFILNAKLNELDFVKKFDPYQAFQEIDMYFGSVLLGSDGHKSKYKGQMIEPELDDVTKRDSKGFDKWSFRKEPTKKK